MGTLNVENKFGAWQILLNKLKSFNDFGAFIQYITQMFTQVSLNNVLFAHSAPTPVSRHCLRSFSRNQKYQTLLQESFTCFIIREKLVRLLQIRHLLRDQVFLVKF